MNNLFLIPTTTSTHVQYAILYKSYQDTTKDASSLEMIHSLIERGLKLAKNQFLIEALSETKKIRLPTSITSIILIGILPSQLNYAIKISRNKLLPLNNESIIYTDEPQILLTNPSKKKEFWEALQPMFQIN